MSDLFDRILQVAAFEDVEFPVSEASTEGGQDLVEHRVYRRPGADLEPTGQQPYKGKLTCPLINGLPGFPNDLFPNRYYDLLTKFETSRIGTLRHPTKGTFRAMIKSWGERLNSDVRNGVELEVEWVEHNNEAGKLLDDSLDASSPSDAPTTTEQLAATADTAMAAADSTNTWKATSPTISTHISKIESGETSGFSGINNAINQMVAAIDANLVLSVFGDANAHEAVVALENLKASVYRLKNKYLPERARPSTITLTTTMSVFQVAQLVYQDVNKTNLIHENNSITNALFIPAGTKLIIPPLE